jgi:hypothetical protein
MCPQLENQSEILLVQFDEPIRDPPGEAISDPYGMENQSEIFLNRRKPEIRLKLETPLERRSPSERIFGCDK